MLDLDYLVSLAERHRDALHREPRGFTLRGKVFDDPPHLMGVVNLSPDSWYRESVCLTADSAVRRARRLVAEGADIIDLGAESTLLDAERVDVNGQLQCLLPVLQTLSDSALISIETYEPEVAHGCLKHGAAVLNLTGPARNAEMFELAARHRAGVIICYVQAANVREAGEIDLVEDHVAAMLEFFARETAAAQSAGVEAIWIDPGMGFYYKNLTDSVERIRYQLRTFFETFRLLELGWPVCHALPHAFEFFGEEVRTAESFFAVAAVLGRTGMLRTHEIAKVRAVVQTMRAFKP